MREESYFPGMWEGELLFRCGEESYFQVWGKRVTLSGKGDESHFPHTRKRGNLWTKTTYRHCNYESIYLKSDLKFIIDILHLN